MPHYSTLLFLCVAASGCAVEDGETKFCFSVPCESDDDLGNPPPVVRDLTIAAPSLGDETACPAAGCYVALLGRATYVIDPGNGGTFTVSSDPSIVTLAVEHSQATLVGRAAGDTELVVDSRNFEPVGAPVSVAERITEVRLDVPAYTTIGTEVAYLPDTTIVVAIEAARGADVRRAIDESVTTNASQLAWDTFQLPAETGPLTLAVEGDSFGMRTFVTEIVSETDRLEARATPDAEGTTVCFHSFLAAREVVAPVALDVVPASGIDEIGRTLNCVRLAGRGEARVFGTALDRSVDVTITR